MSGEKELTESMILQKSKADSIYELRNLNMWGINLTDISIIEKMPNLEAVSLSVNKISTLKPFSSCRKLKELFLRNNKISDFLELTYLQNLPNLRTLWLNDNPIANSPNYRLRVIQMLPQLQKLDESEITQAERDGVTKSLPKEQVSSPTKKYVRHPRKDDGPCLTAVLSLLPQLSLDSLEVVLHRIRDLSTQ